jgi:hypothetical protein
MSDQMPIVFNTQKEFEDAVMAVLAERLSNVVCVHSSNIAPVKVEVLLIDNGVEGAISFDWDEE